MTTKEVAQRYYEMYQANKRLEIQNTMYGHDAVSTEPAHVAQRGMAVVTTGLDAIKAKGEARRSMIEEIHGTICSEPLVAGNFFTVSLSQDVTFKGRPRATLAEIAVFEVRDGKIVHEQFFF